LSKNTGPGPAAPTIKPPSAGPTALATLNPAAFSATASCSSEGETTSGTIACHAGVFIAAAKPRANVSASSIQGDMNAIKVSTPRAAAESNIQP